MIYFVRHAPTPWNEHKNANGEKDPLCQGVVDILLDDKGQQVAREMGNNIKDINFDRVICSPLGRTKQTCYLMYQGKTPVEIDPRIIERNFGEFEGKTRSEFDFKAFWNRNASQKFKRAESIQDVEKRVFNFLDELRAWSVKNPDKNVLIVSHGGVGCIVMSYFNGIPQNGDYLSFELPHGGKPLVLDFKNLERQKNIINDRVM